MIAVVTPTKVSAQPDRLHDPHIARPVPKPMRHIDPPAMVDDEIDAVDEAKDDESITCPMPEPGYEHGRKQRNRQKRHEGAERRIAPAESGQPLRRATSGQAQHHRIVEIRGQEARQSHVPAQPEIDDVRGLERRIEVRRQLDAKEPAEPQRHIRIAGKVKIDLQDKSDRRNPRQHERRFAPRRGMFVDRRDQGRDAVSEHPFLEQAEKQQREPDRKVLPVEAAASRSQTAASFPDSGRSARRSAAGRTARMCNIRET